MKAVFLREMASYFIAPAGYVYLAAFYCLAGYEYSVLILNGQAEMSYEFTFLYTVTLLLTPVLTMRLMSEDRKQKTDQMLFAAPVSLGGIVAGKYMAAVVVFLMGIGVTILHAFALAPFSEINWTMGIFQFSDFMLFFSFAALFFFLTVRTLERRRWSGQ